MISVIFSENKRATKIATLLTGCTRQLRIVADNIKNSSLLYATFFHEILLSATGDTTWSAIHVTFGSLVYCFLKVYSRWTLNWKNQNEKLYFYTDYFDCALVGQSKRWVDYILQTEA